MKRKIYTQLVDWKNQERRKTIGICSALVYSPRIREDIKSEGLKIRLSERKAKT